MGKKIVIADDEPLFLDGVEDYLTERGYTVFKARNGADALELYKKQKPDLVLLDLSMPDMDGDEVCREIRKKDAFTPIIFITSQGRTVDKVVGLEIGADDYISKPFDYDELGARVKAVLRRSKFGSKTQSVDEVIKFADVTLDPATMTGSKGSDKFELSEKELSLMGLFVNHENQVLKRADILDIVWGEDYSGTNRALDQLVLRLRNKIENDPTNPVHIITSYAKGYLFKSKGHSKGKN